MLGDQWTSTNLPIELLKERPRFEIPDIFIVILATVTMFACGGSESDPTQEALEDRANIAAQLISNDSWDEYHDLFSADSKASCAAANFSNAASASMGSYREFLGIAPTAKFDFKVTKVSTDGDDGKVTMELHQGGEKLNDGSPEPRVLVGSGVSSTTTASSNVGYLSPIN